MRVLPTFVTLSRPGELGEVDGIFAGPGKCFSFGACQTDTTSAGKVMDDVWRNRNEDSPFVRSGTIEYTSGYRNALLSWRVGKMVRATKRERGCAKRGGWCGLGGGIAEAPSG